MLCYVAWTRASSVGESRWLDYFESLVHTCMYMWCSNGTTPTCKWKVWLSYLVLFFAVVNFVEGVTVLLGFGLCILACVGVPSMTGNSPFWISLQYQIHAHAHVADLPIQVSCSMFMWSSAGQNGLVMPAKAPCSQS